nr:sugar transferase [uncultured Blautia sp.]
MLEKRKVVAPVILFVYNRPRHTSQTLEYLSKAIYAKDTPLFVYCDAAKDKNQLENVNKVRDIIRSYELNNSKFLSVNVCYAEKNQGLATSIINGVTEVIEKYNKVIVLEDDLLVARDFLAYMNSALEFYEKDTKIWSISAYSFPMKALQNYKYDIYYTGRGSSWGWATWRDRWNTVDWEVLDYDSIKYNIRNRRDWGRWGQDMPFMLDANVYGLNHSWAIRWCYAQWKQKKYTVYPKISRVLNLGTDGSGTNYKKSINKYDTILNDKINLVYKFEHLEENEKIRREFRKRYMHPIAVVKWHLWWMVRKLGIISIN